MGFLKRFLSLGSKKSRRKHAQNVHNTDLVDEIGAQTVHPVPSDEDNEIAANLLLRSSSARYAVVAETDYTSLPPLPHPINSTMSTPTGSTNSLPITSISRRGTYTVKVHPRQQHTCTEFPLANRALDDDRPRRRAQTVGPTVIGDDSNHLQGLRRDPSVASLLDLYDEHGHLPSKAFSNTPPRQGRAQTQRTSGSTLRELLGEPNRRHNPSSSLEGDISWAERFLAEANSAASSVSSLVLQTPENFDSRFSDSLLSNAHHDSSFLSDHDLSSSLINNPAISSMEVELSTINEPSEVIVDSPYTTENPHQPVDPKIPRRASEVFGFLTEKQKQKSRPSSEEAGVDRPLPDLQSVFSSPSNKDSSEGLAFSRFSANTSDVSNHTAAVSENESKPIDSDSQQRPASRSDFKTTITEDPQARKVKVIMTGPQKIIVTAPTPLADVTDRPTSRMPKGPRSIHGHRQRSRSREYLPGLIERSNSSNNSDPFTPIPSRPMKLARRTSASLNAQTSLASTEAPKESKSHTRRQGSTRSLMAMFDKENTTTSLGLSATPDIPFTPVRSSSRSSLLRSVVTPASFKPPSGMAPSPASSSELSPVGKKMMNEVRKQRQQSRKSSGHRRHPRTERS